MLETNAKLLKTIINHVKTKLQMTFIHHYNTIQNHQKPMRNELETIRKQLDTNAKPYIIAEMCVLIVLVL